MLDGKIERDTIGLAEISQILYPRIDQFLEE
jgi:hypothetical protein